MSFLQELQTDRYSWVLNMRGWGVNRFLDFPVTLLDLLSPPLPSHINFQTFQLGKNFCNFFCNFNHLLLFFIKLFYKAERGLKLVHRPHFEHDFLKKNISHVLLTDQILLPDFEKLHKIHRKIPVQFLRAPFLQNIWRWLLLNQLGIRSQVIRGLVFQPPFLRHLPFDPVCPHFLKFLFSSPLFCSTPL